VTDLQRRQSAPDPRLVQDAVVKEIADELERRAGARARVSVTHVPPPSAAELRIEEARAANRASLRNAAWVFAAVVVCALALIVVKGLGWAAHSIPPSSPGPTPAATQPH
jgi:hypothetical protein